LQIITGLKDNHSHTLNEAGSYEKWYFDGIDEENEYSFVIIFYKGNPHSAEYNARVNDHLANPDSKKPDPLNFCALSFDIYLKSRIIYRVFFEYAKNKFSAVPHDGGQRIYLDKSNFYLDKSENKYYININFSTSDLENKFKAEFIFSMKSDGTEVSNNNNNSGTKHYWAPSAPICDFIGKFKLYKNFKRRKTDFEGFGYLDTAWGDEPMFNDIEQRYWGRVISNEYSVVYTYINYKDKSKADFKKILIYQHGNLILDKDDFEIKIKNSKNIWFLNYGKDLTITAGDFKFNTKNEVKVDSGPAYMRFHSCNNLFLKNKSVMTNVTGISDYFNPEKILSGFMSSYASKRIVRID